MMTFLKFNTLKTHRKLVYILTSLFILGFIDFAYGEVATQRNLHTQRTEKNDQLIRDEHYKRIASVHPDYKEIAYAANFPLYISSLPLTVRDRAKDVVLNGSSREIINILHGYKDFDIPPQTTAKLLRPIVQTKNPGMLNKKEIIANANETTRFYEELDIRKTIHLRKIAEAHPNYEKIAFSSNFHKYINSLPTQQRKAAESVFESGSAKEIIVLLSNYKRNSKIRLTHIEKP